MTSERTGETSPARLTRYHDAVDGWLQIERGGANGAAWFGTPADNAGRGDAGLPATLLIAPEVMNPPADHPAPTLPELAAAVRAIENAAPLCAIVCQTDDTGEPHETIRETISATAENPTGRLVECRFEYEGLEPVGDGMVCGPAAGWPARATRIRAHLKVQEGPGGRLRSLTVDTDFGTGGPHVLAGDPLRAGLVSTTATKLASEQMQVLVACQTLKGTLEPGHNGRDAGPDRERAEAIELAADLLTVPPAEAMTRMVGRRAARQIGVDLTAQGCWTVRMERRGGSTSVTVEHTE